MNPSQEDGFTSSSKLSRMIVELSFHYEEKRDRSHGNIWRSTPILLKVQRFLTAPVVCDSRMKTLNGCINRRGFHCCIKKHPFAIFVFIHIEISTCFMPWKFMPPKTFFTFPSDTKYSFTSKNDEHRQWILGDARIGTILILFSYIFSEIKNHVV